MGHELRWFQHPFDHFFVDNAFEDYAAMIRNLPPLDQYRKYSDKYPNRYLYDCADPFWRTVVERFYDAHGSRIRVQLCRDLPGYSIGPHTDGKKEYSTILYYLAQDDTQPHLGTSVYTPRHDGFTCDGSRHHERDDFDVLFTVPYLPNTGFGFIRSDNSFHGVDPTTAVRDIMQISIWR